MKIIILLIVLLSNVSLAHAKNCAIFPIKGDGSEKNAYDAAIPKAVRDANPKGLAWTNIIPANPNGTLKYSDVITCFHDSVPLPGVTLLSKGTVDATILLRDPKASLKIFNDVAAPKPKLSQVIDRIIRQAQKYIGAAIAWAASATDNFNRSDLNDLGAAWDNTSHDSCQLLSNKAYGTADGVACMETFNTLVPGDNQYAQIEVQISTGTLAIGPAVGVRMQTGAVNQGYICRTQVGDGGTSITTRIQRREGGGGTNLASETATVWLDGDVVRLEASGTNLNCYRNGGAALISASDSTYTSGRGGIYMITASGTNVAADNFEVGDLGSVGVARRKPFRW